MTDKLSDLQAKIAATLDGEPQFVTVDGEPVLHWDTPRILRIFGAMLRSCGEVIDDAFLRSVTASRQHVPSVDQAEDARDLVRFIARAFLSGDANAWKKIRRARDVVHDAEGAQVYVRALELLIQESEMHRVVLPELVAAIARAQAKHGLRDEGDPLDIASRVVSASSSRDRFARLDPAFASLGLDYLDARLMDVRDASVKNGKPKPGPRRVLAALIAECGAFGFVLKRGEARRELEDRALRAIHEAAVKASIPD